MNRERRATKREQQARSDAAARERFIAKIAALLAKPEADRDLAGRSVYEIAACALAIGFPDHTATEYAEGALAIVQLQKANENLTAGMAVEALLDIDSNPLAAMLFFGLADHLQTFLRPFVGSVNDAAAAHEGEPLTLAMLGLGHLQSPWPEPAPKIEPIVLEDDEDEPAEQAAPAIDPSA